VFLRRYYALFFIAYAIRRVWLTGCSTIPAGAQDTQQARNLGLEFADEGMRYLIRDRDSSTAASSKRCFAAAASGSSRRRCGRRRQTPLPSGLSETVRVECLDWLLILNRRYLVLRLYVEHYNAYGAIARLDSNHLNLGSHRHQPSSARSTASAASSTSTTDAPPDVRHD
jgi:hypothetical protein